MATERHMVNPGRSAAPRDYKDISRRILKVTRMFIRHSATTIGWASHIWFNLALPLSILLAGLAIMAGLVFLSLVILAPDNVQSIPDFRSWLYSAG